MRLLYILMIAVACLILVYCCNRAYRKSNYMSRAVIYLEIAIICFSLTTGMANLTHDRFIANIAYGLGMSAFDWVMIFFIKYVHDYTVGFRFKKNYAMVTHGIAVLDMLSMVGNSIWHHAFTVDEEVYQGWWLHYAVVSFGWPMILHDIFVCLLAAWIVFSLVWESTRSSKVYRRNYLVLANIFLLSFLIDSVFQLVDYPLRLSVMLFAVTGVVACYVAIDYVHKDIVNMTLETLVDGMDEGVSFFDNHHRLIYFNDAARRFLNIQESDFKEIEERNLMWYEEHQHDEERTFRTTDKVMIDGKRHFIEETFTYQYDEQGFSLGNSFVVVDRTNEYDQNERERYLATHDSLTGFYTMERFLRETRKMLDKYPQTEFCMICSNIKDFKLVNELFGTSKGDEILMMQASLMKQMIRQPATYGRIGGDRFALCIPRTRYYEKLFVDNIRKMRDEFTSKMYPIHIYVGVYFIENNKESVDVMCDKCHLAIKSIEGDYSRIVAYCDDALVQASMDENRLLSQFMTAVSNDEFEIFLQPQMDLDGTLVGAEALARWKHPELGWIMPDRFISVLEDASLIQHLDVYVWEQAIKTLQHWSKLGWDQLYMSVNISVKDFFYMDLFKIFTDLVDRYGVDPKRVKLEITESVFLVDPTNRLDLFYRLQEYGFLIELDDFGSGYSSLNMLKDIHVDGLKIDQTFLRVSAHEERGQKVLKGILSLATDLDMNIVVEGVETKEQLEQVKAMGAKIIQGYYYSSPIPVHEFELKYRLL